MRDRLAYLHLPKAAGTSIRAALAAYYDPAETVPWSFDRHMFGGFAHLDQVDRPVFLGDPTEFRTYRYMEGHWSLPTILAGFDHDDVACILREPRSRFLSQYAFWRSWGDEQHAVWHPYTGSLASRRSLRDYASEASIASISDNLATRMVLGPHSLVPDDAPIRSEHIDIVARHACTQLDRIGFVDVIERGEATYVALEAWFGSPLSRERLNETQFDRGDRVDLADFADRRTQALVNDRSAADLQVWHHVYERRESADAAARSTADGSYGAAVAKIAIEHSRTVAAPEPAADAAADRHANDARPLALTRLVALARRGPRVWLDRIQDEIAYRRGELTGPGDDDRQ